MLTQRDFLLNCVQVGSCGLQASWAGGERGRQVIDRFLPQIAQLLSPTGVCYLLILKENDPGRSDDFLACLNVLSLVG